VLTKQPLPYTIFLAVNADMPSDPPNEGQTSILITKPSNTYSKLALTIWVALFPDSPMHERSVSDEKLVGYGNKATIREWPAI